MFDDGDRVTIVRGKNRGPATIVGLADAAGQYAVRTQYDVLALVKADNLKAPAESMIGEGKLAAEIQTAASDIFYGDHDPRTALQSLVSRLSGDMPGLGARISWPAESAGK